jgi:tetratricopeptide (TPR) repeat protein
MALKPKSISPAGISAAIAKAERYRYLNEPEEAESICRDILEIESTHQLAQRILGLAITDQFTGGVKDRFAEASAVFSGLEDQYSRSYYSGILHERHAKAQLRVGRPAPAVAAELEEAMRYFERAEQIRPAGNDETILRWNRCLRLLQTMPQPASHDEGMGFESGDSAPHATVPRQRATRVGRGH